MLRIKKDVDLKELEKFEFTESKLSNWCYTKDVDYRTTCFIDENYRHIFFGVDDICSNLDILFDLIQAGLVEKVVDDE